jgi:hypothetical protein
LVLCNWKKSNNLFLAYKNLLKIVRGVTKWLRLIAGGGSINDYVITMYKIFVSICSNFSIFFQFFQIFFNFFQFVGTFSIFFPNLFLIFSNFFNFFNFFDFFRKPVSNFFNLKPNKTIVNHYLTQWGIDGSWSSCK